MVLSRDKVQVVGALRLPLGGINGYVGVRSRQGYNKDKFQGTTPGGQEMHGGGSPPRRRDPSSTLGVTAGGAVRRKEKHFYMLFEQYGIQRRPHPCGT